MVFWGAVYHSVVPQRYMLSVPTVCLGTHIRCGIGCTMMRISALALAGISKNPWNTKQGLRKRSLQGSAHGSLLQPRPKFHGAGPCTHNGAIIEGADNGWKLHNPHLLITNRDGVAICGCVSNSKHGCKYQEIRTPSQLLSPHSTSKGPVVVGARA